MNKKSRHKSCINCEPRDNCDFILNEYGYCCYCIKSDYGALIFNLYIYEKFRRLGHAKEIIEMCIIEIRKSGYEKEIKIEAEPKENSIPLEKLINFYKKMGLIVFRKE